MTWIRYLETHGRHEPHSSNAMRSPRRERATGVGAERARAARLEIGLTQGELGGSRFSKEYVSQVELGKTRPSAGRPRLVRRAARRSITWCWRGRARLRAAAQRGGDHARRGRDRGAPVRRGALRAGGGSGSASSPAMRRLGLPPLLAGAGRSRTVGRLDEAPVESVRRPRRRRRRLGLARGGRARPLPHRGRPLQDGQPGDSRRPAGRGARRLRQTYRRSVGRAARPDLQRPRQDPTPAKGFHCRRRGHRARRSSSLGRSTTTGCWRRRTSTPHSLRSGGTSTPSPASTPSGRSALFERVSDHEYVGKLLNNLGQLRAITGTPEEAVPLLRESFRIAVDQDNRIDAAFAASSLASARMHTGDLEGAIESGNRAIELLR